ncbi:MULTISPECIES: manganese-binding transcriptional regulator MntR [Hyphomicrobiales]|nr:MULTISPECIES: manganese-binding transcriptional regulator MntR [Hyphomicrobiales]MBS7743564.1 manganese-binding transcriptional regulator MntR [Chelatococcus sp. HY11]MBX3546410.1 manganese-binding transcriptional regulator MntR [Chelatococcus sp.]HML41663.1 manganese-binding transcriptional regulator MntR [Hyphomicrobium zavarzinii]
MAADLDHPLNQKATSVTAAQIRRRSDSSDRDDPRQAERFEKARAARSMTLLEDYVELIADLLKEHGEARTTDIARILGVTHPTATKTIARLRREGLAVSRPYRGVFLTEAGIALADRVRRRHRLVVELLIAVGVPQESAEADAEGIEHHVSDVTLSAFERYLKKSAAGGRSLGATGKP